MITFNARADFGFTGQYVAKITGRHPKYTFVRSFLGQKGGKRNEQTTADVDEPGLYVECDVTKRGKQETYFVTLDGEEARKIDKEIAMKIGTALDKGRAIESIVQFAGENDVEFLTEAKAARKNSSETLEDAIGACAAILGALPDREVRRAIIELRRRCIATKETAPAPDGAEENPSA